jgi:hypothetical protein
MRRRAFAAVLVGLSLTHAVAHAEPNDDEKQLARRWMSTGRAQRAMGDYRGAVSSFTEAHRIMGVPTTLLETARAHADVAELLEARALLRQLPGLPVSPDEPAPFVRARTEAAELSASLDERVPRLRVDLSGAPEPEAAELWVDGAVRPDCRHGCELDPGKHLVEARSGTAQAIEQVALRERERQTLELVFSPNVVVTELGAPPLVRESPRSPTRQAPPTATWVFGGVAVAGLAASAALGIETLQRHRTLEERCSPRCSQQELDGLERRALYTNVALGIGLGSAALAVATYFILPSRGPSSGRAQRWNVEAGADPRAGAGSVSLAGTF